jgi:hypothetical protein
MGKTIAIKLSTLLVFFLHCVLFTHAQTRTVTGTVIVQTGRVFPGLRLVLKAPTQPRKLQKTAPTQSQQQTMQRCTFLGRLRNFRDSGKMEELP